MKTKFLLFCSLCLNMAYAGVAGSANNDPLVFYGIVLLILGVLIGTPSLIKFIKKRWRNKKTGESENI